MIKCPECGHQVSDAALTCPNCGIQIAGKVMKCPDCGEIIFKDQEMCPNCHCPINKAAPKTEAPRPVAPQPVQHPTAQPTTPPQNRTSLSDNGNTPNMPPTEQPKKKSYTVLIVSVVIALIIIFVGMYIYKNSQKEKEQDAYEEAMKSSDLSVLQDYLTMYPDASEAHKDSIQAHIEKLNVGDKDWMDAVMSGSKSSLEAYLQKHPGSVHEMEAKQKIDSLDWVEVSAANTPEAYQRYINDHGTEGSHYDEAQQQIDKLNNMKVTPDDKQMISSLFTSYFESLGAKDESGLCSTISSVLNNFLGKKNATKTDVMNFMNKIFKADITSMKFTVNNDYKIDKVQAGADEYSFNVSFSVDQNIDRTDASKEKFCTYKVKAKVSPDGKISEINMTKILQ